MELKARSFSPREISEMLGICEQGVYELIRRYEIETVVVDYWKRIPKDAFWKWYNSQKHYKTAEDREKEAALLAATVTMPEMARMLGTSRQKVYEILKNPRYQHFFEIIEIGGRRRITRESLEHFLEGQDRYQLAEERVKEIQKVCHDETGASRCDKENTEESGSKETLNSADRPEPEYMTLQEAAGLAGISRQALCKYIEQGAIEGVEKYAGRICLPKQEFGKWMIRLKAEQDEYKKILGKEYHDYGMVLATPYGMPLGSTAIRHRFSKLIKEHDLPKVVFHSLRHTSVTYKLKLNGGDIKAVQGDSGHSQVNMVTDVYSHILDEDRKKNAQLFEEAFYKKKNLDPQLHDTQNGKMLSVPDGVDAELLAKVLANPEMVALLTSLAKTMQKE